MSMESEQTFALSKFNAVVMDGFFRDVPRDLRELGRTLCGFLWDLDGRCHTQDWEGVTDRVAVWSLPVHLRRWRTSKNYASVYRPMPGDRELTLEVILPGRAEIRERVLAGFAEELAPSAHALGQPRFLLKPGDFPGPYAGLILEARRAKARPLESFLENSTAGGEATKEAGPARP
jgi:hypothetical protein